MTSTLHKIIDEDINVYFLYKDGSYIEFPSFEKIEAITVDNVVIDFNIENIKKITDDWTEFDDFIYEEDNDNSIIIKNKEYVKEFKIISWDDLYDQLLDIAKEYNVEFDAF